MAESSNIISTIPRAELAKTFPAHRVRAAFEALISAAGVTLPDSIDVLSQLVEDLQEGPPPAPAPVLPGEDGPPLTAILDRLSALELAVSELHQGATPL